MQKKVKYVLYLILILLLIIAIWYFVKNVGPNLIFDFIIWLGEDCV